MISPGGTHRGQSKRNWPKIRGYPELSRFHDFPQPLYVLPGPGLDPDERILLVSDTAWTAERVQTTLARIHSRDEVMEDLELPATGLAIHPYDH